ncbi:unnamed protein product [Pleuronectes platessa]|uniref:Uncharacterized protein n=1 Tax=Pleuronectes platessa TaxID=8262 RepID=A0A9N7YL85_PLEPL|nr:unnamed protein product [Pleuronectes platessa]
MKKEFKYIRTKKKMSTWTDNRIQELLVMGAHVGVDVLQTETLSFPLQDFYIISGLRCISPHLNDVEQCGSQRNKRKRVGGKAPQAQKRGRVKGLLPEPETKPPSTKPLTPQQDFREGFDQMSRPEQAPSHFHMGFI